MLNIAAIIVSIISLVTSTAVAGLSAWFTYRGDERKSIREAEKLLRKYREPLLLAAQDLQSRLFNILDTTHPTRSVLSFAERTGMYNDTMFVYTAFLIGQYLAWVNILRRQAQFTAFTTEVKQPSRTREFIGILDSITDVLNKGWQPEAETVELLEGWRNPEHQVESNPKPNSHPRYHAQNWDRTGRSESEAPLFILFKGQQRAIGEIMTVRDNDGEDGELLCMGYSEFTKKWKKAEEDTGLSPGKTDGFPTNAWYHWEKAEILTWFLPITRGIHAIVSARRSHTNEEAENTLRVLQHLLVDLVKLLDPKGLRPGALREREKSGIPKFAIGCWCKYCRQQFQEAQGGSFEPEGVKWISFRTRRPIQAHNNRAALPV